VILINLLPHREAARKRRREAFQATMLASFLIGLLVSVLIYTWFQGLITDQQGQNDYLTQQIKALDVQIKEIATLEEEITALQARQKAVEDLQSDRNLPVHLFTELVNQLPDGVYISSIKQEGLSVTMQGTAQSNERISEMLRNLTEGTAWFSKPELMEIVAKTVDVTAKDKRRAAAFTLRFNLTRASDAEKNLLAASSSVKAQ